MLLDELVDASERVSATRSRKTKAAVLAEVLASLEPDERAIGARYVAGEPRQERLGVGYRLVSEVAALPASQPTLTLREIDDAFEAVAAEGGPGSKARRLQTLRDLFSRATEREQRFLRSLILRELRQGALEGLLVEALATTTAIPVEEVQRAAMVSGDVAAVAVAALEGGAEALATFSMEVGKPLLPMLASPGEGVAASLERHGGTARIDTKVDGARIQVHKARDRVWVYTRNLRDVTSRVPEVVEVVEALPAASLVLDGEAVGVTAEGRPVPFQETMARFGRSDDPAAARTELALTPLFFDLLHLDGRDLISEPLEVRVELLAKVVPEQWRAPGLTTSDPATAEETFDAAIASGHEGVMVKDPASVYAAGRRGSAWLKVKPVHTLDLVVLAVEWGSGRRTGKLSNLHLGARDPEGGFVMLGKTFKGLTDEMLAWQTERFLELETSRQGHVVHVRPEQVVEIAFDGVQQSSRYPGGMALRFARVKGYRDDKTAAEADSIDAVRAIFGR